MADRQAVPESALRWRTQDHALKEHMILVVGGQEEEAGFRYAHRYSRHFRVRYPGSGGTHGPWAGKLEIRMGPGWWGPEAERPEHIVGEELHSSLGIPGEGIHQSGES